VRLVAVSFDVHDPTGVAAFWSGVLGRSVVGDSSGALLPGHATTVGLRFVSATPASAGPDRLHLHLTSATLAHRQHTVDAAVALGAVPIDVGQLPEEGHIVLADPGGNAFCVIEPRNGFLSGCGFLGEVSCDGTREVGLFWRDVLGWPLVWDQDGETAVQSPQGGTKVSWGGPPVAAKTGRSRQRLDLATADVDSEVARLMTLGATELGHRDGGIELADPDGNEFSLRSG